MPPPDSELKEPPPEVLARAHDLVAHTELLDIRPCSLSAHIQQGVAPGARVASVEIDLALSFAADKGVYANRFDYKFVLRGGAEEETLGTIEFSMLVDYDVDENFTPDRDAAEFVTSTTGYFAVYPYVRELFQSLAGRLQFDPVVLGLIKRGEMHPGVITVVPRALGD
jgi:hypothetical protein